MSVVAAAIIGSSVVGAVSANKAAGVQSKAIETGAKLEQEMGNKSLELQKELAEQQRTDFTPWREAGQNALQEITAGIASGEFDPGKFEPSQFETPEFKAPSFSSITEDPGYQFRLQQGIEARDRSASSRGRLNSGAQQKGIENFAQGTASQEYGNAYARAQDDYSRDYGAASDKYSREAGEYAMESDRTGRKFNILSGLSGAGQSSAAGQAQVTSQLANNSSNIMAGMGSSQRGAAVGAGAARAGAYSGTAQSLNQAASNWLTYKMAAPVVAPTTNYGP